jgi:YidC/Oxa1 family membrane protein insertase
MDYLTQLLANLPNGFWENLIGYVVNFVGNYGLAIVVFSILLKIVLSPLDFYQRKITKNNTEKQAKLKPELDKLQKKYGDKKELLNQKTMELYKKENYNIVGSCFGMLLNMVLTLVIFISLFGAMRNISEFKLANQFNELETTYNTTYQAELVNGETVATQAAEQAVLVKYTEIKDSFLWVSNVWMPDTSANVIPSYERFLSLTQLEEAEQPEEGDYNKVMGVLRQEYSGWNGYYILIILAGAITYLSQKVMQGKLGQNKQKDQADGAPQVNMNFMLILFPVLMIIFTLSYSAAFALYIVINSAMSMFISMLSTNILNKIEAKKQNDTKPEYSR